MTNFDARALFRSAGEQAMLFADVARHEAKIGHERLAELARETIVREFAIQPGSVAYDLAIVRTDHVRAQFHVADSAVPAGVDVASGEFRADLERELHKRAVINALIHGGAERIERLAWLDPAISQATKLATQYEQLMQLSRSLYQALPTDFDVLRGASFAGESHIDLTTQPPEVIARAVCLPVLLQEAAKGTFELVAQWGLPGALNEDHSLDGYYQALRRAVLAADSIGNDIRDNQLGPKLWQSHFPEQGTTQLLEQFQRLVVEPAGAFSRIRLTELG